VLSDRFVLDHWWDDTLGGETLHNVVAGCDLGHGLLLVDQNNTRNLCLLTGIHQLEDVKESHTEGEWSKLSVDVLLAKSLFSDSLLS